MSARPLKGYRVLYNGFSRQRGCCAPLPAETVFSLFPYFLAIARRPGDVAQTVAVIPVAVAARTTMASEGYWEAAALVFSLSAGTMCLSCSMRAVLGRLLSVL